MALTAWLAAGCSPHRPGASWSAVPIPTDAEFGGVWFADSLNGWLSGGGRLVEGGLVGRTRDGGLTWRFHSGAIASGGVPVSLGAVQFADTLHGCVVGSSGLVMLSDDGGETWRKVFLGRGPGDDLFDVQRLDTRLGWAAGPACVLKTVDGGQTWGALLYNTSQNGYLSPNAVCFTDAERGWLACRVGQLMRSIDGGISWTRVQLPPRTGNPPTLWDVTFNGEANGWAVGEQGTIYHTHDAGATWEKQENGVPMVRVVSRGEAPRPREVIPELETEPDHLSLTAVGFADSLHGWALGYYADVGESVVLGTGDGGASWRTEHVEPGEILRALFVLDARHAWAAGRRSRTAPQVVLRYAPPERR